MDRRLYLRIPGEHRKNRKNTWDARHHLAQITQKRTTVASFAYDALGRRMSKTVGGTVTQFMYDGLNPVAELDGASPPNVTANLLTGLGLDEYFARSDASGTMAFMTDALGSTVGLVNAAGGIDTSYAYQPFGATTVNGTSANPYQFTGRENDGAGLYFYRARYYSPTFQRFVSQDPIGFAGGGTNLYSYVRNDPMGLTDSLGLETGAVSLESSQNPTSIPVPDIVIGVDSPIGGVQTTIPFGSGGEPTTVTRPLSWTQPLPWPPDAVAKVFIQTGPTQHPSLQCQVRSPVGGFSSGVDTHENGNANVLGPQINFPVPGTGVNFYVGSKW